MKTLWLMLPLLAAALPARAGDPRDQIRIGNEHFEAGRYDQAWEAYQQVDTTAAPAFALDLQHNQAAAAFKLGRLDEARELWTRIASRGDAAFEAQVRYNLGNCDYQDALAAAQPPAEGAEAGDRGNPLELLDRAIANYRDALRLDPTLENARANLELAARFRKQLEEQSEQSPESQPSEDPDGEEGEDGEQSEEGEQNSESQNNEGEESGQSDDEQSDQDDASEQEPSDQGGQQDPSEREDGEQDETSEQPGEEPEPQQDGAPQQPEPQPSESTESDSPQQAQPLRLSQEEAERLLQRIRDAEQQRRAALRAREAARHQPVEKDW